jgi:hypothetical protein
VVIGVEPISLELGTDMTPTIAACIPELMGMAVAELTRRGYVLQPLTATALA